MILADMSRNRFAARGTLNGPSLGLLPESASEAKLASSHGSSSTNTTTAITDRRPRPSVQGLPGGCGLGARVERPPLRPAAAAMYVSTQMADKMATKRKRLEGSGATGRTPLGVEGGGGGDQQRRSPFLIGVAGGTASGKSTVCKKIVELLDQQNVDHRVGIISQDCFYRELEDKERVLATKGCFDFDHPSAFDDKLMATTLKNIKDGQPMKIPKYDFVKNARDTENEQTVNPADVILVEGILVFYFKEIRDMFNMKLFVDTDADTRLSRRVLKDTNEHKRPLEQILNQYTKFVKPAFEEFCLPTKKYADIIIPRGADNTVAIDLIVQHIRDLFDSKHDGLVPDLSQPQSHNSFESLRSYSSVEEKDLKYTSAH